MKKMLLTLLISVIGLGLFANGSKEEVAAADGKVNLRMVAWDVNQTVYLQPLVDAYIALNPKVSIELINVPVGEYQDKLSIMLAGGDDVDIITVKDIPGYSGMVSRRLLEPLNETIKADGFDLGKFSGLTADLTINNELYAIPFRSDFWLMYYNKDIFDAAGLDYPTNDITWDEYAALAAKVSSGSGVDKIYGGHHHTWRSTVQLGTVQDGKHSIISEDYSYMKPMYERIMDMQNNEVIMDYASLKVGNLHYSGLFYNEEIAMLPMGSWFISSVISKHEIGEATMNWGLVKFPHQPGALAGTTAGTITSLAVNVNSTQKAAAWDFIKFYTGEEGAIVLAKTGNLPAIKNDTVLNILASKEGFPTDAASKEALVTVKVALELPLHPKVSIVEKILNEEHELILIGESSIDEGLAEMSRRVKLALSE